MKTIVYLIRHSEPLKSINYINNDDSLQLQNEKTCLSINGEILASKISKIDELQNIDVLFSSNYVRTIATAKYIADENNLKINVVEDLGERKFGINNWSELPENFESKQFLDKNYKIGNGESQREVRKRMYSTIMKILNKNKNKRIAIVSHATAISYLLKKWCDIDVVNDKLRYSFLNNVVLDGYFNYCEIFKLEFENNKLINIENIKRN